MFNKDLFYKLLAISALIALGIYIIACRPSWSPDSSKVAYVYRYQFDSTVNNPVEGGGTGVCIYDVVNNINIPIMDNFMDENPNNTVIPAEAIWLDNGYEILVVGQSTIKDANNKETSKISIQKYNINDKSLTPIIDFEAKISAGLLGAYPILLHKNRWLWIFVEKDIYRIDIKKNKIKKIEEQAPPKIIQKASKYLPFLKNDDLLNILLFQNKKNMFFVRIDDSNRAMVFGKFHPNFLIKQNDYFKVKEEKDCDINPILAATSKGDKFAYIVGKEDGSVFKVVNKKGKESYSLRFPSDFKFGKDKDSSFIFSEWNSTGNIIWIPALTKKDDKDYYVLIEIDINKSTNKLIPISSIKGAASEIETDMLFFSQISISPDNKYLSFVIFYDTKKINGEDIDDPMSLCLIDLTKEEREVKIIDPPINLDYKRITPKNDK